MKEEWVIDIQEQFEKQGVAFFFKQWDERPKFCKQELQIEKGLNNFPLFNSFARARE